MYFYEYNCPFVNYDCCGYRGDINMHVRRAIAHITKDL